MKNLLLYLGLGFGLVTVQVNAMDNQKQLISPKELQALDELRLDDLPSDFFSSPKKSPAKSLVKEGKQEVSSPTKGGMTQDELDQFASFFNSPEKAVSVTSKMLNSPEGKITVGFNSPEKCHNPNIDKKLVQPGVSGLRVTSFQIPNQMRLDAIATHAKNTTAANAPIIIFASEAYENDQQRSPTNRALKKLSQVVSNLYILNVNKQFKNRSGKQFTLHTKTYSWINELGQSRVCGLGSDNTTQQAVKNQEMSLYLKGDEAAQVRRTHELFVQNILPYCTKYSQITQPMQGSNGSQIIDFSNLAPVPTLPPASPTLPLSPTLVFAYTNSVNWRPFIKYFLKEKARKVSAYSISDEYLAAVEKNRNCDLLVNYDCYKKNSDVPTSLAVMAAEGRRVGVFNGYGSELHTKFAIGDDETTLIGEGNFTPTGLDDLNGFSLFCRNPAIFKRCNDEWEKQFNLPETQKVKADGSLKLPKRSNDNNNNNNNNKIIKRALFTAGSN